MKKTIKSLSVLALGLFSMTSCLVTGGGETPPDDDEETPLHPWESTRIDSQMEVPEGMYRSYYENSVTIYDSVATLNGSTREFNYKLLWDYKVEVEGMDLPDIWSKYDDNFFKSNVLIFCMVNLPPEAELYYIGLGTEREQVPGASTGTFAYLFKMDHVYPTESAYKGVPTDEYVPRMFFLEIPTEDPTSFRLKYSDGYINRRTKYIYWNVYEDLYTSDTTASVSE